MSTRENKTVWSLRVSPELKKWFEDFSRKRCTEPQEEARRAMADFREYHDNKKIEDKKQEPVDGDNVPLCDSGEGRV